MTDVVAAAQRVTLSYLRENWGSAYAIAEARGRWLAVRRDGLSALRADGALELLLKIREDYAARPVRGEARLRP